MLSPESPWVFLKESFLLLCSVVQCFFLQIVITVLDILVCHCVYQVLWGAVINCLVGDSCVKHFVYIWLWLHLLFFFFFKGVEMILGMSPIVIWECVYIIFSAVSFGRYFWKLYFLSDFVCVCVVFGGR